MAVKPARVLQSINPSVARVYSYINPSVARVYVSINTECECLRYIYPDQSRLHFTFIQLTVINQLYD